MFVTEFADSQDLNAPLCHVSSVCWPEDWNKNTNVFLQQFYRHYQFGLLYFRAPIFFMFPASFLTKEMIFITNIKMTTSRKKPLFLNCLNVGVGSTIPAFQAFIILLYRHSCINSRDYKPGTLLCTCSIARCPILMNPGVYLGVSGITLESMALSGSRNPWFRPAGLSTLKL